MRRALLPFILSFSILLAVVSLLSISEGPALAGFATFTPPPTLTPLTPFPTSTPISAPVPTPGPGPVSTVVGVFYHQWETGTIGGDCGLSFSYSPSVTSIIPIPSSGGVFSASGGMSICVPERGELYKQITERWRMTSSLPISVSVEVLFLVDLRGRPSKVEAWVEGYYLQDVGSGLHRVEISNLPPVREGEWYLYARCRYWGLNDPGFVYCGIRQRITFCGPDGCNGFICGPWGCGPEPPGPEPPLPPPPQDCCFGPGECEFRPGQFLRIRGAAPVLPVYDVQLQQLGVVITGDLPGSYVVFGSSPRTKMLLISSQPLTYLLSSANCVFPVCGGASFCSVFSPGGIVPVSADCVGPEPTVSVVGIPILGITSWDCPFTAFCARDFPPYDLGQGALSAAGECAHPGFPDGYWVPVSGTVAAASNAFDIDEYWLFVDYSGLVPSLPISSPVEYRDGNEMCFDIPPFGDELNGVLTRLFSRSIDVLTVCIFPRYFKLRGFPGSDVVFDGLVSLFVLASALLIIRALHRLGRA